MATKIAPRKARQPRTNLFYEQITDFLFKVLLWFFGLSLFFCGAKLFQFRLRH
jgi:monofunctional biosynthetic peptidoglycan transglycosylase